MYGEDDEPISDFSPFTGLQHCQRGYALGAMAMAKSFYSSQYEFVCKCDQTDEEIEHAYPRKIQLN